MKAQLKEMRLRNFEAVVEPTVKLYDASKTQVKQRAYEEYLKVVKRHQ